jgi:elongator complex protein 3
MASGILPLLNSLRREPPGSAAALLRLLKKYPNENGQLYKKTELLEAITRYHFHLPKSTLALLTKKPVRTLSGVATVTVLTKPFPCPGRCIFCPSDIRMPKSYISSEPGAQRAANNFFDPYLQTYNRLTALKAMGHPVEKAEVLVLGGTWSVYPLPYKIWFIQRVFAALNDFGSGLDQRQGVKPTFIPKNPAKAEAVYVSNYNQAFKQTYPGMVQEQAVWADLEREQQRNQSSPVKCVGLVLESRPDAISAAEVLNLRRLGGTKTQIGLQSLNDAVLRQNKRGHTVAEAAHALSLLRAAGFKIHAHWMPNLYGSNVKKDLADYRKLFSDRRFRPDELKIYPCSLISKTELVHRFETGAWQPYTKKQLTEVIHFCLTHTPRYCRLTRIIRDIPSHEILVGNKLTNFRQLAEAGLQAVSLKDIRAREIKNQAVDPSSLRLKTTRYHTESTLEYFLEYVTDTDQLAAFLRLSLPDLLINRLTDELNRSALIREVHVYGQSLAPGKLSDGRAQHTGLGRRLIQKAIAIAQKKGYPQISVISAIGTRGYYQKLGFTQGRLYQHYEL